MEENQMQAPVGAPVQSENVGFPGSMQPESRGKKSNKLVFIIIIIFLLFIGGITFLVFKSSRTPTDEEPVPTESGVSELPTSTPTSGTPTPSPVAIAKKDVKVQVLNGTGVAGEAGILQKALNDLGYTKIDVGNATDQSATSTIVVFSSTLPSDIVDEITTKLKAMYVSVDSSSSSTGSTYDVKITTGPRKGQTTSATGTPKASATPTATP